MTTGVSRYTSLDYTHFITNLRLQWRILKTSKNTNTVFYLFHITNIGEDCIHHIQWILLVNSKNKVFAQCGVVF